MFLNHLEIIKIYFQSSGSVVDPQHLFARELDHHRRYFAPAMGCTVEKFKREVNLQNNKPPIRKRSVWTRR